MGTWSADAYLERLCELGVGAGEIQLPASLTAADLLSWRSFVQGVCAYHMQPVLSLPMPFDQPVWEDVIAWINELAQTVSPIVLVHGIRAARPQMSLVDATVSHVRSLCYRVPSHIPIAVLSGWNSAASHRLTTRFRHWQQQRGQQQALRQRPSGVGSGMGNVEPVNVSISNTDEMLDPPLDPQQRSLLGKNDGWAATGTRDMTLAIVEQVGRSNCMIGWDLAHDWLSSYWELTNQSTIPDHHFLQHVGYVRIHDAMPDGTTHLPLVVGNVPYASQLRALSRAGFDGVACVSVRYTDQAQTYGGRWQLLGRSLVIARQGLRI